VQARPSWNRPSTRSAPAVDLSLRNLSSSSAVLPLVLGCALSVLLWRPLSSSANVNIFYVHLLRSHSTRALLAEVLALPPGEGWSQGIEASTRLIQKRIAGASSPRSVPSLSEAPPGNRRAVLLAFLANGHIVEGLDADHDHAPRTSVEESYLASLSWVVGNYEDSLRLWRRIAPLPVSLRLLKRAEALGSSTRAHFYFTASLAVRPGWWQGELALATWYEAKKMPEQWRDAFTRALRDPAMPEFNRYVIRGRLLLADDPVQAVGLLRRATELNRRDPWCHVYLAEGLERVDPPAAVDEYTRAIRLDPRLCSGIAPRINRLIGSNRVVDCRAGTS
jgi:tetratricopeptide (TPR) repeat protein